MATAHLIHGYLGVGKTTFARRLERQLPAIRFSQDEWMTRLYGDDPPVERFEDFYRRVYQQVEEIWPRCLELGVDVVLDFGFWNRLGRDATIAKIIALGGEARLYRLSCPEDETWRRLESRNLDLLYIARNTFEVLKARFEPLGDDEERIEMGIRRAVQTDVPRIMEIRHSLRENRLSDPDFVTAADCETFIERSEIGFGKKTKQFRALLRAILAMAGFSGCSLHPNTRAVVSVRRFYHWPARRSGKPVIPLRN